MSKSLAELRAGASVADPRSYLACVGEGRALLAEVQSLTDELSMLPVRASSEDEERDGPPRRVGEGKPPRATEIRERLAVLLAEMATYEGVLRIEASRSSGEWRRWVNEHPARAEGSPGHARDGEVTGGYCNADDLLDDLATYVVAWNDEPLAPGDFEKLGIAPSDEKVIATAIVTMYEGGMSVPRWRSALSATLAADRTSSLHDSSESQSVDSSGGNPLSVTSSSTPKDAPADQPTLSL